MKTVLLALALLAPTIPSDDRPGDRYVTGQVWAYRTRSGEEGSLLKIQAIEYDAAAIRGGPIYHVSVIGVHFADPQIAPILPHVPVSRATLDASVTRLVASATDFPDATEGIAEWRRERGGVYTIPLADIIAAIDAQTGRK